LCAKAHLWRLAAQLADQRHDRMREVACLEKSLDIEFANMPEVFDLSPIRNDYGKLLDHYEYLAGASRSLKTPLPADLLARVVRAADRWRGLDSEADPICERTARVLRMLGSPQADELAWDYMTTPLALKPNESAPWLTLGHAASRDGKLALAEQCYEAAFAAEPTNAQILWDRAQLLERQGAISHAKELYRQIATGTWQPRFDGLKELAKRR